MKKLLIIGYTILGTSVVILFSHLNYIINLNNILYINLLIFFPTMFLSTTAIFVCKKVLKKISISDLVISVLALEVVGSVLYFYQIINQDVFTSQVGSSNVFLYGITNICLLLIIVEKKFYKKKVLLKVFSIIEVVLIVVGVTFSVLNCFTEVIS